MFERAISVVGQFGFRGLPLRGRRKAVIRGRRLIAVQRPISLTAGWPSRFDSGHEPTCHQMARHLKAARMAIKRRHLIGFYSATRPVQPEILMGASLPPAPMAGKRASKAPIRLELTPRNVSPPPVGPGGSPAGPARRWWQAAARAARPQWRGRPGQSRTQARTRSP